jgi:hypothetical protein
MDKLVVLLGKYRDAESLALLDEKRIQLQGMMGALGLDEKGKHLMKRVYSLSIHYLNANSIYIIYRPPKTHS